MAHCSHSGQRLVLGRPPGERHQHPEWRRREPRDEEDHRRLSLEAEERILGTERRRKLEKRRKWLALPREEREVQEKWRVKGTGKFEDKFPEWEDYRIPGIKRLLIENKQLDASTYASLMRKCGSERSLKDARRVHSHLLRSHFGDQEQPQEQQTLLANLAVQMFGRCRSPQDAVTAFKKIKHRNIFSWSIMVECYFLNGMHREAVELYREMIEQGVTPNNVVVSGVVASCNRMGDLDMGKQVQANAAALGIDTDPVVTTALIQMHSKLGNLAGAVAAFEKLKQLDLADTIATTAMIKAYVRYERCDRALDLYWWMRIAGLEADGYTFSAALGACTSPSYLLDGKHIHKHALESKHKYAGMNGISVKNALIGMYSRCGQLKEAVSIFESMDVKEAVTWNVMIAAYALHGRSPEAFRLFNRMADLSIPYDFFTFTSILDACFGKKMLEQGKRVHSEVVDSGLGTLLLSNLISMYASCDSLQDARKAFDEAEYHQDVKAWTMMLDAYAQRGQDRQAVQLYRDMLHQGVHPDRFTFSTVASSCASLGAFEEGRKLDECVTSLGLDRDRLVGFALVNMYDKTGSYEDSKDAFDRISSKDMQSWGALLAANAHHGRGDDTMQLSFLMNQEGVEQNEVAASSILHSYRERPIDEGIQYFVSCLNDFGTKLSVSLHVGLVALLGRAGWLKEAELVALYMPFKDTFAAWMILLSASKLHGNVRMAKVAAKQLMKLRPEFPGSYILLASVYATKGRWDDVHRIKKHMSKKLVLKQQIGSSSIEIDNRIYEFKDGDRNEEIAAELEKLYSRMRTEGCSQEVTGIVEEDQLEFHSEKLAMAFGLTVTKPERTLRIIKQSSSVCSDCHTFAKLLSKLTSREIILRDGTQFHHFRQGLCSCGDLW